MSHVWKLLGEIPSEFWAALLTGLVTIGGVFAKGWNDRKRDQAIREEAWAITDRDARTQRFQGRANAYTAIARDGGAFKTTLFGLPVAVQGTDRIMRQVTYESALESAVQLETSLASAETYFAGDNPAAQALKLVRGVPSRTVVSVMAEPAKANAQAASFTATLEALLSVLQAGLSPDATEQE